MRILKVGMLQLTRSLAIRIILGILVAGANTYISIQMVQNLNLSIQRGKQQRNLANMRVISTAIEMYRQDYGGVPSGHTIKDLEPILEPRYLKTVTIYDPWGNVYIYRSHSPTSYTLISLGKDRLADLDNSYAGPIRHFTNDISLSNGTFVVYPEGT